VRNKTKLERGNAILLGDVLGRMDSTSSQRVRRWLEACACWVDSLRSSKLQFEWRVLAPEQWAKQDVMRAIKAIPQSINFHTTEMIMEYRAAPKEAFDAVC